MEQYWLCFELIYLMFQADLRRLYHTYEYWKGTVVYMKNGSQCSCILQEHEKKMHILISNGGWIVACIPCFCLFVSLHICSIYTSENLCLCVRPCSSSICEFILSSLTCLYRVLGKILYFQLSTFHWTVVLSAWYGSPHLVS